MCWTRRMDRCASWASARPCSALSWCGWCADRKDSALNSERELGPMQHCPAVQEGDQMRPDRCHPIVPEHRGGDGHVAAIIEGRRDHGLARGVAKPVGAAAPLHVADRDLLTGAERRNVAD